MTASLRQSGRFGIRWLAAAAFLVAMAAAVPRHWIQDPQPRSSRATPGGQDRTARPGGGSGFFPRGVPSSNRDSGTAPEIPETSLPRLLPNKPVIHAATPFSGARLRPGMVSKTPTPGAESGAGPGLLTETSGLSPVHRKFDQPAETSGTMTSTPQFRPMPPGLSGAGNSGVPNPVILEFSDHQQLPAVLAAADPGVSMDGNSTSRRQEAENRIAEDFVATVNDPTSAAVASEEPPPLSSAPAPASASASGDQRWDAAVRAADEQYRILVGQEVYLRKSLEAALLKRQAAFASDPP